MDGRHRFILQRLKDGFNIQRVTIIEQFLSQEKVLSQINDFFRADGIPTLIFLYQPAQKINEDDGECLGEFEPLGPARMGSALRPVAVSDLKRESASPTPRVLP